MHSVNNDKTSKVGHAWCLQSCNLKRNQMLLNIIIKLHISEIQRGFTVK